jgi:hypothetical protein
MAEKEPCDCSDYEYDLKDCHKELEKTKEKLTSLREEKFLVCEQAKEQADEKIEMLKKQLTRWTIGGSVAATVVGKEAVEEITATIQGVEEAVNTIVPGAIPGVGSMIPGAGGAAGPTPITMPDGSTMFWDPSMGWMNGSAGFFGGAGGVGMGASNNVANQNPEKAKPKTEDEEEEEEEEKGKKDKEEEEEAEEEEEENEEESEDEESEESEDKDDEDSEDAEEEEEADPAEMEEEENQEDNEDSTEDSEDQEQSEESSDEQASNDAQQPEVIGLPSPELVVEDGKIIDVTGETLADYIANLGEVAQVWDIPDTPNLIESIPAILNSRQPQPGEVIVGDYETNDPLPPQTLDDQEVIIIDEEEDVYVPESPVTDPPYDPSPIVLEANMIPEPGILLALFIPYIWQLITKRRRKK